MRGWTVMAAGLGALLASGCVIALPGEDPEWHRLEGAPPGQQYACATGRMRTARREQVAGIVVTATGGFVALWAAVFALGNLAYADIHDEWGRDRTDVYRAQARTAWGVAAGGLAVAGGGVPLIVGGSQGRSAWGEPVERLDIPERLRRLELDIRVAEESGRPNAAERLRYQKTLLADRLEALGGPLGPPAAR